jgi:hypothetical protein
MYVHVSVSRTNPLPIAHCPLPISTDRHNQLDPLCAVSNLLSFFLISLNTHRQRQDKKGQGEQPTRHIWFTFLTGLQRPSTITTTRALVLVLPSVQDGASPLRLDFTCRECLSLAITLAAL